jgi:hypothetical protein
VTRSEFLIAVRDEFGEVQGRALMRDLVLGSLEGLTAQAALDQGIPAKTVWQALCEAMDVPVARQHGVGIAQPPKS